MASCKENTNLQKLNQKSKNPASKGPVCTVEDKKAERALNWKSVLEKRAKMYEIYKLKNKIAALQSELWDRTAAADSEEQMYNEMKKSWGIKLAAVARAREAHETVQSELRNTLNILESRLHVLRKEKNEIDERTDYMKTESNNLERELEGKGEDLEALKSDLMTKQNILDALKAEGQKNQEDFDEKMRNMGEEREEMRKVEMDLFNKRMESLKKDIDDLDAKAVLLSEERDALRMVTEGYVERLKLLEKKEHLLTIEFHHYANADIMKDDFGVV